MKREDVKAIIPGITEEQLQQIMDLHSGDIGAHKQSIETLKAERDAARTQLADANKKLEGYDPDWKQKAADAEQKAAAQVSALKADYAAENAAAGLKFSSVSAKKAFLADLKAKGLTLQDDGKLLGFDDFVREYKGADPTPSPRTSLPPPSRCPARAAPPPRPARPMWMTSTNTTPSTTRKENNAWRSSTTS